MASSKVLIEEDNRSIHVQKNGKPLQDFYSLLMNNYSFIPYNVIDSLDSVFDSFLNEKDFQIYYNCLILLFRKVNFYSLQLANIKIALNIARIFDDFLTKFKTQITKDNMQSILNPKILEAVLKPTEKNLMKLEDTDYTIAVVYLKHFGNITNLNLETLNLDRLQNNQINQVDSCVVKLINEYGYSNDFMNDLICFQYRVFIITRGTMILTTDIIELTLEHLESSHYKDIWIKIYADKMLANLIVPVISYLQQGNHLDVKNKELLYWLLIFTEKSLDERFRDDKWESVNENDFKNTWNFVKKNATKQQIISFELYLLNNGFIFQLNDPIANESYNLTP